MCSLTLAVAAGLAACRGEAQDGGAVGMGTPGSAVEIFASDGSRQCEPESGVPLTEMQRRLDAAGIGATGASCGLMTGVQVPAVCGGLSTGIYVFTVRKEDLDRALALGFEPTAVLPGAGEGSGWEPVPCP